MLPRAMLSDPSWQSQSCCWPSGMQAPAMTEQHEQQVCCCWRAKLPWLTSYPEEACICGCPLSAVASPN